MSNQKYYAAIPDPKAELESLRQSVLALKQTVEVLTQQRAPLNAAAITYQDLIDIGLLNRSGDTLQDNATLLKYLHDTRNGGTIEGALQATNNLSDLDDITTAVATLGLTIGTDVLAYDAQLTSNIRQNNQNGNYTTVLSDGEKHLYYNSGAGPYTWTIAANASVAYPVGTAITFINLAGGPTIAIAIGGTDTLYWSPSGGSGTRTLANYGMATAIKFNSVGWIISGTGLT